MSDHSGRPPGAELVNAQEAARLLGLSEDGVRKLVSRGQLRRWKLAGYWVRYDRAEVERLVLARAAAQ